jgi:hypothetical protein
MDTFRNGRLTRVVAAAGSLGVDDDRLTRLPRIRIGPISIPDPFPGIACHVVKPIAVGRERMHGAGGEIPVRAGILEWKYAFPVGGGAAARAPIPYG